MEVWTASEIGGEGSAKTIAGAMRVFEFYGVVMKWSGGEREGERIVRDRSSRRFASWAGVEQSESARAPRPDSPKRWSSGRPKLEVQSGSSDCKAGEEFAHVPLARAHASRVTSAVAGRASLACEASGGGRIETCPYPRASVSIMSRPKPT